MMKRLPVIIVTSLVALFVFSYDASAQFAGAANIFRNEAFSQSYNDDNSEVDSSDVVFSFKTYFNALGHKNEYEVEKLALGSALCVGGLQIYNKQYWKLPLVYGGIGAGLGGGIYYNSVYKKSVAAGTPDEKAKKYSTLFFIGAGAFYWGTMLDGVISYKPDTYPNAGKAMMYSILFPGAGQIYNKEYWKLPIYWGGLAASYYFFETNRMNFQRFSRILDEMNDPEKKYEGPYTRESVVYYKNTYRRFKDYSALAIAIVYLLQVIDANVFSTMQDFEVDDNISMNISPAVISPDNAYAGMSYQQPAIGMSLGINF
ncbi:MAG: DUF5683 domain-containing protein [Bacteroidales bacterium]|nr:DUF5683 domain-containing protein [Bacteroidales bacterium]